MHLTHACVACSFLLAHILLQAGAFLLHGHGDLLLNVVHFPCMEVDSQVPHVVPPHGIRVLSLHVAPSLQLTLGSPFEVVPSPFMQVENHKMTFSFLKRPLLSHFYWFLLEFVLKICILVLFWNKSRRLWKSKRCCATIVWMPLSILHM